VSSSSLSSPLSLSGTTCMPKHGIWGCWM
jgi:hypothetical protein